MKDKLCTSTGTLRYSFNDGYKLIVEVDQGISDYYRSLIPKYIVANPPRYPAHITVVRSYKETPTNLEPWGKYEGEKVEFFYDPEIKSGRVFHWLNAFCKRLEDIRLELGLPVVSEYTLPPEGFVKCFHITVANQKS